MEFKEKKDSDDQKYLHNPLPLPPRRRHVRMEFDLQDDWEISDEKDHFDIEIPEDDDFDI